MGCPQTRIADIEYSHCIPLIISLFNASTVDSDFALPSTFASIIFTFALLDLDFFFKLRHFPAFFKI